ncbi:PLDc N-terminal domain-containing protein [Actinotalea subterranea]|uniref:PLDc N-terminal domain-containing protein n=1 Tax=Actinotalea subterranea TaxID=2607497 RepID=UPI0011EEDE4C|nr:PLDc N-terminal domain-containing protein [Actinotalea subterranea]
MLRNLIFVVDLALLVFALIDCIQTDSILVRNLPKTMWVFLIILVPVVGPVAWLVAGRPERGATAPRVPWPSTQTAGFPEYERPRAPKGPDDDPDFLADLRAGDAEHERMLRDWENQLREREQRLAQTRPEGAEQAADRPEPEPRADGTSEPRA